jgi:hypothetical protein
MSMDNLMYNVHGQFLLIFNIKNRNKKFCEKKYLLLMKINSKIESSYYN